MAMRTKDKGYGLVYTRQQVAAKRAAVETQAKSRYPANNFETIYVMIQYKIVDNPDK